MHILFSFIELELAYDFLYMSDGAGKLCILDWGMTLAVPDSLQYALLEFIGEYLSNQAISFVLTECFSAHNTCHVTHF